MTETGPVILGLETSCDETACAVVAGGRRVLANVIATQHEPHRRYAGVVPEIASRAHLERIVPVLRETLAGARLGWRDLDAVAVGHRPGLIGALLVGTSAAKAIAWSLGIPVIGIDHVVAHLHAGLLDAEPVAYPALGLVVSGGHTSLFEVEGPLSIQLLGRTIDDAAGEAFDKAAAILGLGYPGGPALEGRAERGDERAYDFPVARLDPQRLDFSFSGLKTALLYVARGQPGREPMRPDCGHLSAGTISDLAASFQRAAIAAIIVKLERALDRVAPQTLLVGGGVTANGRLRREVTDLAKARGLDLRLPPIEYCLDNAAMIAGLAASRFEAGSFDDWALSAAASSAVEDGRVLA